MKKDVLLIGGGGHCKSVIDVIELEDKYNIIGIVDKKELIGTQLFGYKIIGCDDDLGDLYLKCQNAIITIGQISSAEIRVQLFDKLKKIGFTLVTVISPLAYISKYSIVEEGSVVMHNVLINAGAKVGKNCIINTKALIEHDAIIESHCHISTAAIINGGVKIGEKSFIGSGVITKQYIKLEAKSFIKAGSLVK